MAMDIGQKELYDNKDTKSNIFNARKGLRKEQK